MEAKVVSGTKVSEIQKRGVEKARADIPAIFTHIKKLVSLGTDEIRLVFGFAGLISQNNVVNKDRVLTCRYDKQCKIINEAERTIYLTAYISELKRQLIGLRFPEPKLGAEVILTRDELIF